MLQQTQVDRVIPKYQVFITAFPDVQALARAPLAEVLRHWQGLGYNRRAKFLHEAAQRIHEAGCVFPIRVDELEGLPGVGSYTARAVATFAYGSRVVLIETNVRTVYLHHFFPEKHSVRDSEVVELIEKTLPKNNFRTWYYALMDYGAYLKKVSGNANIRSKHYIKQSRFKGSNRELRGKVIRFLAGGLMTKQMLSKELRVHDIAHVSAVLDSLKKEGLVVENKEGYQLPT
jgi:A/G-specific adenine glycosylase